MKKIDEKELKKIQLDILDKVHDFCIKNHIDYWLDSGTLIGAIRHKGYIPWDDDIDIGMLRNDYDRFLIEFNRAKERYKCYSIENKNDFYYPFAKILDTDTVLYEPDERGKKLCVNIDLFPYDIAPDDDKALKKMYRKRNLYQRLRAISSHNIHSGCRVRRWLISACSIFFKILPKGIFDKKIVNNAKKYKDSDNKRIGNFTSVEMIAVSLSVFNSFILVDFEGKKYKAPVGYDIWLRAFYGDYMILPPEEQRVSHHNFVAFCKEEG